MAITILLLISLAGCGQRADRRGADTALVVMDPWVDMRDPALSAAFAHVTSASVLPVIAEARRKGYPVIVLTNNPRGRQYNTRVDPRIKPDALLYHQDFNDEAFAAYLRARGVRKLIYVGFASDMCVIGRELGMVKMLHQGFKIEFIPEASAAVGGDEAHRQVAAMVDGWIGKTIPLAEFVTHPAKATN